MLLPQIESLRAFAGKALTTFDAGFAATFSSLPNITLVPAFRAGLCLSSSVSSLGMTNFLVFFGYRIPGSGTRTLELPAPHHSP